MKKMKYLFMTLAIVGMFALSIQSNIYAADSEFATAANSANADNAIAANREIPVQPELASGQGVCKFNTVTAVGGGPLVATGSTVTINNELLSRRVILQFSSEVLVTGSSARMDLLYSIDGGAPVIVGPEFFAKRGTDDVNFETNTAIGIIFLPQGVHTIQPFIRLAGPSTSKGTVWFRCMTAEGRTR